MGSVGPEIVEWLFKPAPRPTARQRVKALLLNVTGFVGVVFTVACGSVGFAVLARRMIRWWIG